MANSLTFLGTGTSSGIPLIGCSCPVCTSSDSRDQRLRTSAYVQYEGLRLIIDAGPDYRQQMIAAGISNPDAILLTHAHMDHIGGLDDIRSFNYLQKRAFPIYCEDEVEDVLRKVFYYAFDEPKYPGAPDFEMHRIKAGTPFYIHGVEILPVRIFHGKMPIVGFRFGSLAYLTDVSHIDDESFALLKGVNLLVVSTVSYKMHHSHFSVSEALDAIEKLAPRRAFITHLSHRVGTYTEFSSHLPEGVSVAFDGLTAEF